MGRCAAAIPAVFLIVVIFRYLAPSPATLQAVLNPTPYEDRFYDQSNPGGDAANLRVMGVLHTAEAFNYDREHIKGRLAGADIILAERYLDVPGVGAASVSPNWYFMRLAQCAIDNGKDVYFIDTRESSLAWLNVFCCAVVVATLFLSAVVSIAFGWKRRGIVASLTAIALTVGMFTLPNPVVQALLRLPIGDAAKAEVTGWLDLAPTGEGFSVRLLERAKSVARQHQDKQVLAVVGDTHAWMASWYLNHPNAARMKIGLAQAFEALPIVLLAPIAEVKAAAKPNALQWSIPRS